MKKIVNVLRGVALLSGLVISPVLLAVNSADLEKNLAGSTASELSASAAHLVAIAQATDKEAVAVVVVRTAITRNPAAFASVLTSVVQESPASAAVVANAAANLLPKRIGVIAKVTAAAAPSQAGAIVAALMKQFPNEYGIIAGGAAKGAPASGREILAVIAKKIPALKSSIESQVAQTPSTEIVPVQLILTESYNQAANSGVTVALSADGLSRGLQTPVVTTPNSSVPAVSGPQGGGPVLGPPFTGSTTTPTTYSPGNTTTEQSGGRGYASP